MNQYTCSYCFFLCILTHFRLLWNPDKAFRWKIYFCPHRVLDISIFFRINAPVPVNISSRISAPPQKKNKYKERLFNNDLKDEDYSGTKHTLPNRDVVCCCKAYFVYKKYSIEYAVMSHGLFMKVLVEFSLIKLPFFENKRPPPKSGKILKKSREFIGKIQYIICKLFIFRGKTVYATLYLAVVWVPKTSQRLKSPSNLLLNLGIFDSNQFISLVDQANQFGKQQLFTFLFLRRFVTV